MTMPTKIFQAGDETIEVRPCNTQARILLEKSLAKHNIEPKTNASGAEMIRLLLVRWERNGKDLVMILPPDQLRDEISKYDGMMERVMTESLSLAAEMGKRYEADTKN